MTTIRDLRDYHALPVIFWWTVVVLIAFACAGVGVVVLGGNT